MSKDLMVIPQSVQNQIQTRGMSESQWLTLANTLYPGASPMSVLMVWDYCAARKLDPFKKPVHIVSMNMKVDGQWVDRETVLPGIYEYRTTAQRTGEYVGKTEPEYGPENEAFGVIAPEWCKITVYRWNDKAKEKAPFTVKLWFREACGTKRKSKDDHTPVANGRWQRAPIQMLTKCCEAAALREAFPEEIGGVPTMEEIEDHMPDVIDVTPQAVEESPLIEKLSDDQRAALDKAFGALKMSKAQGLVKVNEFLKPENPSDGVEALLEWCRDEYAKRQGTTRAAKTDNSKKATKQEPPAEVKEGTVVEAEAPKASPRETPKEPKPAPKTGKKADYF